MDVIKTLIKESDTCDLSTQFLSSKKYDWKLNYTMFMTIKHSINVHQRFFQLYSAWYNMIRGSVWCSLETATTLMQYSLGNVMIFNHLN